MWRVSSVFFVMSLFIYWLSWVFLAAGLFSSCSVWAVAMCIVEASLAAECSRVPGLPELRCPGS